MDDGDIILLNEKLEKGRNDLLRATDQTTREVSCHLAG